VHTDRLVTLVTDAFGWTADLKRCRRSGILLGSFRFLAAPQYPPRHPDRRYEYVHGISQERGLIALDQMAEPRQRECSRDQQQSDDPVEPDHDDRRKSDRDRNQVQSAVYGMVVRAVIVRIEAHDSPRFRARIIAQNDTRQLGPPQDDKSVGSVMNFSNTSFDSRRPFAVRRT